MRFHLLFRLSEEIHIKREEKRNIDDKEISIEKLSKYHKIFKEQHK